MRYRVTVIGVLIVFALALVGCGDTNTNVATDIPDDNVIVPGEDTLGDNEDTIGGEENIGGTEAVGGAGAAGSPESTALMFIQTALSGGDVSSMICSGASETMTTFSDQLQAGAAALSQQGVNAQIDTTGLTVSSVNETAEAAEVTLAGTYSVLMDGQDAPMQAELPPTTLVLVPENGEWRVCGTA